MHSGFKRFRSWALPGLALALILAGFSCSTRQSRPNVVLIVVDSLRPDYLGCNGYDRPTSPSIDALAATGVVFENVIAHAPWTKPSFSSILTSVYPFQHGVVDWEAALPDTLTTLPEVLAAAGYSTMAVLNLPGLAGEFKVTRGIEAVSEATTARRDAAATTDEALRMIGKARKPFFILIHYLDAHVPYRPSPDLVGAVERPGDQDPFSAVVGELDEDAPAADRRYVDRQKLLYAASVRQVDQGIGRIVAALDSLGIRRETLLMLTADHGEGFMEHAALSHGTGLYDEALKVPLVVSYPGGLDKAARVKAQVRHVDLLPTIVDFTGVVDRAHREGVSLRALAAGGARPAAAAGFLPDDVALSEVDFRKTPDAKSLRTDEFKVIIEPSTAAHYLYDLTADPGETTNLWGLDVPGAARLLALTDRIPGLSVAGWRVALVGARRGAGAGVRVTPAAGGRIARVRKVAGRGDKLAVDAGSDGSSLDLAGSFGGLHLAEFDAEPGDAQLTIEVSARGEAGPAEVRVGATGKAGIGAPFLVDPRSGHGLPEGFAELRAGSVPVVCIWWLPGERIREEGVRAKLTPEERKRLRALGYIQ